MCKPEEVRVPEPKFLCWTFIKPLAEVHSAEKNQDPSYVKVFVPKAVEASFWLRPMHKIEWNGSVRLSRLQPLLRDSSRTWLCAGTVLVQQFCCHGAAGRPVFLAMFLARARRSHQRQEKSGTEEWQLQTKLGASSTAAQGFVSLLTGWEQAPTHNWCGIHAQQRENTAK